MKLAPSILAGDLADLAAVARLCEAGGAEYLHFDVMDGHFVPNLTFGAPVGRALARHTDIPLDVHLMVANPGRLLDDYFFPGVARIAVHWETAVHLDRLLARIREAGIEAGVALNPATPAEVLHDILPAMDFVLLMSVNPGFAGQPFLPYVVAKTRRLASTIAAAGLDVGLEMDGGLDAGNVREVVDAGVEVCVSGSAVFSQPDPAAAMRDLVRRASGVTA